MGQYNNDDERTLAFKLKIMCSMNHRFHNMVKHVVFMWLVNKRQNEEIRNLLEDRKEKCHNDSIPHSRDLPYRSPLGYPKTGKFHRTSYVTTELGETSQGHSVLIADYTSP